MALIRFRLVKTKVLMFVNTVEQGYRLKLFLEAFSLRACLLNSELPKR